MGIAKFKPVKRCEWVKVEDAPEPAKSYMKNDENGTTDEGAPEPAKPQKSFDIADLPFTIRVGGGKTITLNERALEPAEMPMRKPYDYTNNTNGR